MTDDYSAMVNVMHFRGFCTPTVLTSLTQELQRFDAERFPFLQGSWRGGC